MITLYFTQCILSCLIIYILANLFHKKSISAGISYINHIRFGQNLLQDLINIRPGNTAAANLSQYKFYTALVEELVDLQNRYGINLKTPLAEIKKAVRQDLSFEQKIRGLFLGGLFQMLAISSLGPSFYLLSSYVLGLNLLWSPLAEVALFQLLGLSTFCALSVTIRKIRFKDIYTYLQVFYKVRALLYANLPLGEVQKRSQSYLLPESSKLMSHKKIFDEKIEAVRSYGQLHMDDFDLIIDSLWDYMQQSFHDFNKAINALKMLIILLFFVTGYLYLVSKVITVISF